MYEEESELMKICTNCNQFFPLNSYKCDKGLCLLDEHLEPYLDDILEMRDLSPIKDLIESKLISYEQEACENFDPVEVDTSNELVDDVLYEMSEDAEPEEIIKKIFEKDPFLLLKNASMDRHKENLTSPDKRLKTEAIGQIVNFAV